MTEKLAECFNKQLQQIVDTVRRPTDMLKKNSVLLAYVMKQTWFLDKTYTLLTRIWFVLNHLTDFPVCKTCGKKICNRNIIQLSKPRMSFCCKKCMYESEITRANMKAGIARMSSTQKKIQRLRQRRTKKLRYGDSNYNNKDKRVKTTLKKYGVENVFQSESIKSKIRKTKEQLHNNPTFVNPEKISLTRRNFSIERKQEILEKQIQTSQSHYNTDFPIQNEKVKEKVLKSMPETLKKIIQTKQKNHTFNTSSEEQQVKQYLIEIFSKTDVKCQYKSARYPYCCDFYVVSADLYIECNFSWTHGGHFYNSLDEADVAKLMYWKNKSVNSQYYQNAITTWTVRDVKKRLTAEKANLNYLVFWTIKDAEQWIENYKQRQEFEHG